jgi:hypothetical protein
MSASGATAGVAVGIVDALTNTAVGLSYAHHEVHEGDGFTASLVDLSMNNNDTVILAFQTAAGTKRVHMLPQFSTLVGGRFQLMEAPTWNAQSGSSVPILNRKREAAMNSSNILADQAQPGFVAADVMHGNPTGLAGGTSVYDVYTFGERGKVGAGTSRETDETILRPGIQYAALFTAIGNSNNGQIILTWYEHTDS